MATVKKATDVITDLTAVNEKQDKLQISNAKATAEDIIGDFSRVDESLLQSLTQEYLQLEENKTYDMVFTGMTVFTSNKGKNAGQEVPAATLVGKDRITYINGNTVLVNSLKKVTQLPCLVRIVTYEYAPSATGGGDYLDMAVYVLPKSMEVPK